MPPAALRDRRVLCGSGAICYKNVMPDPTTAADGQAASSAYEPPAFEVIALACEVSAYAPDGGESDPLF